MVEPGVMNWARAGSPTKTGISSAPRILRDIAISPKESRFAQEAVPVVDVRIEHPLAHRLQAVEIPDRLDGTPGRLVRGAETNPSLAEEQPLRLADPALAQALVPAFPQDGLVGRRLPHVLHPLQ